MAALKERNKMCHSNLIFIVLFICTDYVTGDISTSLALSKLNSGATFFAGPYLDGNGVSNVTTQIGTHAYLPCKVKQLGNKSVSWVRVRDDHILTVDRMTFIADERFQSFYVESSGVWTLQIKYVQARDAGIYECQVSTEPKISARVHLHVVVPRTELIGDSDRYVKAGSAVILRCVVRGALEPPSYIIWYHGTQQIFTESRRGWKTQLDRGAPDLDGDIHSTIGSLIIESTRKKDSGNYSCSPSNSPPITVSLHVINGESSASAVTSSARSLFDDSISMFKQRNLQILLRHRTFVMLLVLVIYAQLSCHVNYRL
ncbi:zwei Ig domain protein zig-8-like [Anopheles aquasalis]|uniref:zwei Ig domain protein zig-8-like n=1 Tax=Anopheles aquasalis TaxID=42839 RepID=UPI00215B43B7|nr:zwei Ig domain protein zig-8-like [Anopheles aquasalis]XP_050098153.1 zwei Ig domain protein zig-8-like [Anopheles aquasalis]